MNTSKKKALIALALTVAAAVIATAAMLAFRNTHMSKKDKLLNLSDQEILEFIKDSDIYIFENFTDEKVIGLTRYVIEAIANDPKACACCISAPQQAAFIIDVELAVRDYLGEDWEFSEQEKESHRDRRDIIALTYDK